MKIKRIYSSSPWENRFGYCRAIKVGNVVAVSGTCSIKDGQVFSPGDPYNQTMRCLEIIEEALFEFNLNRSNIIRTRMFVTNISDPLPFGDAHGIFFKLCHPATSMIEVKSLILPEFLIEIEADAIIDP